MRRLLMLAAVLTALATAGATAEAGHGYGWSGGQWNSGPGCGGNYAPQIYTYPGYPVHHQTWHDTSHYDYHPGGLQRHGNHFHYVPGHYDLHRTGHWDTHLHY